MTPRPKLPLLAMLLTVACADPDEGGTGGAGSVSTAATNVATSATDASTSGEGGAGGAPSVVRPDPTHFVATGSLVEARTNHTATLLASGRVAIVGGEDYDYAPLRSIELYDRTLGVFIGGPALLGPRSNHTSTRLPSGRVLVAGGGRTNSVGGPAGQDVKATAEIFDPAAGTVVATGSLATARSHHTATLLGDGRVLVVGGAAGTHAASPSFGDALGSVEVYDPGTGVWHDVAALDVPRFLHTATLLADGRVLVAGGSNAEEEQIVETELYDPVTETWSLGPPLAEARVFHAAAALPDGGALVVAGKLANVKFLASAERFSSASDMLAPTASLPESRTGLGLSTLASGRVLATAGLHGSVAGFELLGDAHIYDPGSGSWTAMGSLGTPRVLHTSTKLETGEVLVVGGLGSGNVLDTAELGVP